MHTGPTSKLAVVAVILVVANIVAAPAAAQSLGCVNISGGNIDEVVGALGVSNGDAGFDVFIEAGEIVTMNFAGVFGVGETVVVDLDGASSPNFPFNANGSETLTITTSANHNFN